MFNTLIYPYFKKVSNHNYLFSLSLIVLKITRSGSVVAKTCLKSTDGEENIKNIKNTIKTLTIGSNFCNSLY